MVKRLRNAENKNSQANVLIIACGALAKEIIELNEANNWNAFDLQCIPAKYHNEPKKIPDLVKEKILANIDKYKKIFIAFADCGTGGLLDKLIEQYSIERLPGAHCYAFYAGLEEFDNIQEQELGSFYFTDFFVRHFRTIMIKPYGLDNPVIKSMMFNNYKRVVYLAQNPTPELKIQAKQHADYLGLEYVYRYTGYGELNVSLGNL